VLEWGLGEDDDGSAEDLQLPNPDEISPIIPQKVGHQLVASSLSSHPPKTCAPEEDMQRMARLR